MVYQELFKALNDSQIKYLVVGGLAVSLHGIPRSTYDVDLLISLEPENIHLFWNKLNSLGWSPMVPIKLGEFVNPENRRKWRDEKNMLVLSFVNKDKVFQVIDIFIENVFDFDECYSRRKIVYSNTIPVFVISIDDLINLKSLAGRQQDHDDIEALKKIKKINYG